MTNLRKSFIMLSAAITMGNLQQAGARKQTPPSKAKQNTARAKQGAAQERVSKQTATSKRRVDSPVVLGMPAGSL